MAKLSAFNQWFRDVLLRKQLTHMDAAFILGVHVATVDKLAGGHRQTPSYETLVAIVGNLQELPPELRRGCRDDSGGTASDATHMRYSDGNGPDPAHRATDRPDEAP